VHREIYGDGAEYFNPYSVEDLESAIGRVITPERSIRREELATAGARISSRYAPEAILPAWHAFLTKPVLAEK
jgi:hypothetical protein